MSDLPAAISLREVAPRDGLQTEPAIPTAAKIELVRALAQTGVRRIEACSFVSPKALPSMADAEEVWSAIDHTDGIRYSALVPNLRGAHRALALRVPELNVVVSASETHNRKNVNRTVGQSLDQIAEIIATAHDAGATVQVVVATAFGCPFEGDVAPERSTWVATTAASLGADQVAFGDTTGMGTPTRVQSLVGAFRSALPDLPLNLHFHNTRGTGLANVLAALQMGVTDFDASVGGLGGCPFAPGATGNVVTEDLVHMVEDMGIDTGIDLPALLSAAADAERLVGHPCPRRCCARDRAPGAIRPELRRVKGRARGDDGGVERISAVSTVTTTEGTVPGAPRDLPTPPPGRRPSARGPREWVRAFTGFYPPTAAELADLDPVSRFLYSARSVILVISFQAALIAGLLAITDRRFQALPFAGVLVGYVVLHAISNLSNDYFGARRGHDTDDSPRRRYTVHPLLSGAVSSRLLVTGISVLGAAAVGIGVAFVVLRGWPAVLLVAVGALLLWAYDAAPTALKELGLGEIASFVVWGPLMVAGGYFAISGHWAGRAWLDSVPYGLGVMSILVGKHIDQRQFDEGQHQRTLPVILGPDRARRLNQAVVAGMYLVTAVAVAVGAMTPFALLVVLALPRALRAERVMNAPAPAVPPAGYVGWPLWYHRVCLVHNRAFGWLLLAGLVVGAVWPGSRF